MIEREARGYQEDIMRQVGPVVGLLLVASAVAGTLAVPLHSAYQLRVYRAVLDADTDARRRDLIRKSERAVEQARARYDPRRWDRAYALAKALCHLQRNRTLLETQGESGQVEILPADAGELFDMITYAEALARTPIERALSTDLWEWILAIPAVDDATVTSPAGSVFRRRPTVPERSQTRDAAPPGSD